MGNSEKQTAPVYTAALTGYLIDQNVALYVLTAHQSSLGTIQRSATEMSNPKKQAVVAEDLFPFAACRVPAAASRSPPIIVRYCATLDNRVSR